MRSLKLKRIKFGHSEPPGINLTYISYPFFLVHCKTTCKTGDNEQRGSKYKTLKILTTFNCIGRKQRNKQRRLERQRY